ncbi:response regulator transcription factor [Fluviicola taffensis]|uniref:Two component transcriptional regulator, LuxR family n=1 Tax=Fluviicola taffensis (strain DSM 16823 / NCIMB 13979 / RW262) TaxID=755732 RepID=F2IBE1_FLUTR|nr:response regulator transcription factor [Fluviicola taffensis]AEA43227.1 two component transcriptional regulator, LuxR family [Fluviicola taffensis DSM 16823]
MESKRNIRIAIAEDQSIFRNGLVKLLNDINGFEVVVAVENGLLLIESLRTTQVDLALIDFRMPVMNGIEATKEIREFFPDVKVLLLSMYDDAEFVELAIENGANGYLSKDDEAEEIQMAIRSAVETGYYLSDRTSKMFIAKMVHTGKIQPSFNENSMVLFNSNELTILEMICDEMTTQEISDKLFKSKRTIESARTSMMNKVGARNVVGLVMFAIQNGVLQKNKGE